MLALVKSTWNITKQLFELKITPLEGGGTFRPRTITGIKERILHTKLIVMQAIQM